MVADDILVFTSAIAFVDSCRFQTLCKESVCSFLWGFSKQNFIFLRIFLISVITIVQSGSMLVNKHVFDKQLYESLSLSFLLSTSLWEPCPPFPVFTYSVSSGFPAGSITLVVSVFKYNETESAYLHQLFGK